MNNIIIKVVRKSLSYHILDCWNAFNGFMDNFGLENKKYTYNIICIIPKNAQEKLRVCYKINISIKIYYFYIIPVMIINNENNEGVGEERKQVN